MARRTSKRMGKVDFQEKYENALRPSRHLGYDHDRMGIYFLEKEANALAESEFRRAVWLNPYEIDFQVHLAMCLYQQRRHAESLDVIRNVLANAPSRSDAQELLRLIKVQNSTGKMPA